MFRFISSSFLISLLLSSVQATIYVTFPVQGDQCHGGQACNVRWDDDGVAPLLTTIGPAYVGLYHGTELLIQQISPVDVSATHSLTFTPDPNAGPNSGNYYIKFTAVNPIGGKPYSEYSPFFTLSDMAGSFSAPVSSDTAPISVPSSVASHTPSSISTIPVTPSGSSSGSGSSSASSTPSSSSHHSSSSSPVSTPSSSVSLSRSASSTPSPTPTAPSSSISASTLASSIPSGSLSGSSSSSSRSSSSSSATPSTVGQTSAAPKTINGQISLFITAFALLAAITPLV